MGVQIQAKGRSHKKHRGHSTPQKARYSTGRLTAEIRDTNDEILFFCNRVSNPLSVFLYFTHLAHFN